MAALVPAGSSVLASKSAGASHRKMATLGNLSISPPVKLPGFLNFQCGSIRSSASSGIWKLDIQGFIILAQSCACVCMDLCVIVLTFSLFLEELWRGVRQLMEDIEIKVLASFGFWWGRRWRGLGCSHWSSVFGFFFCHNWLMDAWRKCKLFSFFFFWRKCKLDLLWSRTWKKIEVKHAAWWYNLRSNLIWDGESILWWVSVQFEVW